MNIADDLKAIGFNELEAQVYQVLVGYGFRTAGQIHSYVDASWDEINRALDELKEKGYVKAKTLNSPDSTVFIPMAPQISLSADISTRLQRKLSEVSDRVNDQWSSAENEINKSVGELVSVNEELVGDYKTRLDSVEQERVQRLDTMKKSERDGMFAASTEVQEKIKGDVIPPMQDVAKKLEETRNSLLAARDKMLTDVNKSTEEHRAKIAEASELAIQEVTDFINELMLAVTARLTVVNQGVDGIKAPSNEQLEALKGTMKQIAANLVEQYLGKIREQTSEAVENLDASIAEGEKGIHDTVKTSKEQISASATAIQKGAKEAEKAAVDSTLATVEKTTTALRKQVETLQSGLKKAIDETQKASVEELSKILKKTSKDITSAEAQLTESLQTGQATLEKQLAELVTSLSQGLAERFDEVKGKNNEFRDSLSNSSNESVEKITDQLTELLNFIIKFLQDTQGELRTDLTSLQEEIAEKLDEIVNTAEEERNKTFEQAKGELSELNQQTKQEFEGFVSELQQVLNEVKNKLSDSIESGQQEFNTVIDEGVSTFNASSEEILRRQSEQIREIEEEAKSLLESARMAKEQILNELNKTLSEARDENLDRFATKVNNAYDKVNRDSSRLKDSTSGEFEEFKEKFRESISGLMDSVPDSIESLFINHQDKLQNFERSFSSFKKRVNQHLQELLAFMEANPKALGKKKEEREARLNEHRLLISDFQRLVREIEPFIKSEMDESEMTYEEVSKTLNKTVQYEIEKVETLFASILSKFAEMVDSAMDSLHDSKEHFIGEFSQGAANVIYDAIDEVKRTLVSKLDEPLNSIIQKANHVAKGTEGSEQENRILKTQQVLIEQIREAIEQLTKKLQDGYSSTLQSIDQHIGHAFERTDKLSTDYVGRNQKLLESQLRSLDQFAARMAQSIRDASTATRESLASSMDASNQKIAQVMEERSKEIRTNITEGSAKLREDTSAQIERITAFSAEFNSSLDEIRERTSGELEEMVGSSKEAMATSSGQLIKSLKKTTSTATKAIESSRSSLSDKVGKPLAKVSKDVGALVSSFDAQVKKLNTELKKVIGGSYKDATSHISAIIKVSKELSAVADAFVKAVAQSRAELKKSLDSQFSELMDGLQQVSTTHQSDVANAYIATVDQMADVLDQTFELISEQLNDLQTEVNGATSNALENVTLHISNSIEQIRSDVVGAAQLVLDVINSGTDSASGQLSSVIGQLTDATSGFGELIDSKFKAHVESLCERFDAFVTELQTEIKRDNKLTYDKFAQQNETFRKKVQDQAGKGIGNVQETLQGIPDIIAETLDAAGKSINLLTTISRGAAAIEPKVLETTYVEASKEAIIANLNGLLLRTKSKIDIVAPTVSWLDSSQFEEFSRRKITIITDPSQHTDKDAAIIKKIQDSGTPLTLRKFDPSRMSIRKGLDMIIVARDNEEAMIAHPVNSKDPYGIVTQDEEFVSQFYTIIANFLHMPNW